MDAVKNSIDRDIAPLSVFCRSSECVLGGRMSTLRVVVKFGLAPEGRDLNILSAPEIDMGDAKAATDEARVAKELPDLLGMGVRGQIEILGGLAEEQIADASAHQVGNKSMVVKPVKNLQRFGVDIFSRDRVLRAGNDAGLRQFIHKVLNRSQQILHTLLLCLFVADSMRFVK